MTGIGFPKRGPASIQLEEAMKEAKKRERKMRKEGRHGKPDRLGSVAKRAPCRMGHMHRSGDEREFCNEMLQPRMWAKEIEILHAEKHMYLSKARYGYIADWECRDLKTNELFYVEFKGREMERWAQTVRMWKAFGPAPLQVWKRGPHGFYLQKTIVPEMEDEE